jgi:N-acetylmuramoyl-L-alanine amidase
MTGLPMVPGSRGESVRDLQRRLASLGIEVTPAEPGYFGPATRDAVCAFQQRHGLLTDGECDEATWSALVEANYRLGDRLLYLRAPMLRGDDVAALQRQLGGLGFDAGRVDGIFGPLTEKALKDFQRNAGLTTDGVCGRDVLATFARLGSRTDAPSVVAGVRERERLRHSPRVLGGRRIVLGDPGGLDVVTNAVRRRLHEAGAIVAVSHHPDLSVQAAEANRFGAEVYLGVALASTGTTRLAYYATRGFESAGGRQLADYLATLLTAVAGLEVEPPQGLRVPILRETRMPAVMAYVAPAEAAIAATAALADSLTEALVRWIERPCEA